MEQTLEFKNKFLGKVLVANKKVGLKEVGFLFCLPSLVLISIFLILPAFMALYYSFTDFYLLRPNEISFVGLKNYILVFKDTTFWKAFFNTLYFSLTVVPLQCTLAFLLALLVKKSVKGIGIFRMAYFSPVVTSMTVIAILWIFLYNPNYGLINVLFEKIGLPKLLFLKSSKQAMPSIIFMSAWQAAGYQMMIFLAGLQSIPDYLYEAAQIDGAKKFQQFIHITIPSMYNVIVFVIMITTVQAFKLFTQPYIMTQGGPEDSTKTLVYYIYQEGFQFRNVGYSSTIAIIFFLLVVMISISLKKLLKQD